MTSVLLLIPSMKAAGGTERVVATLSAALSRVGYTVYQVSFDAPNESRYFMGKEPCYSLGPRPNFYLPFRGVTYALLAWRLARLKKTLKIDVTISNLWGADLISYLSGGLDRKVAVCHINVKDNPANHLMMKFRPAVAAIYRRFFLVVAVSKTLSDELKELYRLPAERISYINNFVDRPLAVSKLPDDGVARFVWCGRFTEVKNLDGLLHVWTLFCKERQGNQLVLIGDGELQQAIVDLSGKLGLHSEKFITSDADIVFLGKSDNPADYMLEAAAVLLPSHSEGLPMVILEALSLGVPVIAADCLAGGVRAALLGEGECNPALAEAEDTPAGVLLPVPLVSSEPTLGLWVETLVRCADNKSELSTWARGALERAEFFSSAVALKRWRSILDNNEQA